MAGMSTHVPMCEPAASGFEPYLDEIERYLARCLDGRDLPPALLEACRYALLAGGKRLRPLLSVLSCECCGGSWRSALPAAAATELVHAFSLIHDDLPAIDDDALRRGQPTLHVRFGEAMAILAGDAAQALAFDEICRNHYTAEQTSMLIQELAAATARMIAGQVYDTLGGLDPADSPRTQLETIHRNKTGALIRASCRMGAIAAGADEVSLAPISKYGDAIGLMFQIVDDMIDVTQSAEHTGKTTGKDQEAGKMTFPGVIGLEESKNEVERLRAEATASLLPFGAAGARLVELAEYLAVRTR